MMKPLSFLASGLWMTCLVALPVQALSEPRIRTVEHNEGMVVRLEACVNFQTMVTFGAGERIENVGLGDASQWQVAPNKRGDLLFLKPTSASAFSNMSVVTDRHRYNFELRTASSAACRRGDVVYDLRFTYKEEPVDLAALQGLAAPADPEGELPLPEKRNSSYTYSGDRELIPLRVFDDGTSTYFLWAEGVAAPAVYAVSSGNNEGLINYANRGDYMVADIVARAFTLRRGEQTAVLYNDAFIVPSLDALSPQPRDPRPGDPVADGEKLGTAKAKKSWFGGRN
ncbi:MAG: TrbG/VirB9 family P-type conjugative transfer protein [Asticcacaulis sp.]